MRSETFKPLLLLFAMTLPLTSEANPLDPAQPELWENCLHEKGNTLFLHQGNTLFLGQRDLLRWRRSPGKVGTWRLDDASTSASGGIRNHHPIRVVPGTEYELVFDLTVEDVSLPSPRVSIEHLDYNRDLIEITTAEMLFPEDAGMTVKRSISFVTSSETHTLMIQVNTAERGTVQATLTDLHLRQSSPPHAFTGSLTHLLRLGTAETIEGGDFAAAIDEYTDHHFHLEGNLSATSFESPVEIDIRWRDLRGETLRQDVLELRPAISPRGDFTGVASEYHLATPHEGEEPLSAYHWLHRTDDAGEVDARFLIGLRPPDNAAEMQVTIPGDLQASSINLRNLSLVAEEHLPISSPTVVGGEPSEAVEDASGALFENLSFEEGDSHPEGWLFGGQTGWEASQLWRSTGAAEGQRYITLMGGDGEDEYMQWYTEDMAPVTPGVPYQLRFQYRYRQLGGERPFYVLVHFVDEDGNPLPDAMTWTFPMSGSAGDWREAVLTDRAPEGAARAQIRFSSNPGAKGEVSIDHVRFTARE